MLIWSHLNQRQIGLPSQRTERGMLKSRKGSEWHGLSRELGVCLSPLSLNPNTYLRKLFYPFFLIPEDPTASRKDTFPSRCEGSESWGIPCSILYFLMLGIRNSHGSSVVWSVITWINLAFSLGNRWILHYGASVTARSSLRQRILFLQL